MELPQVNGRKESGRRSTQLPLTGSLMHHFLDNLASQSNVLVLERWMHQEHEARFAEFAGNWQTARRPHVGGEGLLQVNFAATAGKAGDSPCRYLLEDAVAIPVLAKRFRTHEHIIFIIRMGDIFRRQSNPQSRKFNEA